MSNKALSFTDTDYNQIIRIISQKQYIAIICHRSPDADAVGSALALKRFVQNFHNHVDVFCSDPLPPHLQFLDPYNEFKQEFPINTYPVVCLVDCGHYNMTNYPNIQQAIDNPQTTTLNIDHHQSNPLFADYNLVFPSLSSTCEIIYHFFQQQNIPITTEVSSLLLAGILFDTGGFKHNNTTAQVLKICANLTQSPFQINNICQKIFYTHKVAKLKLLGKALSRIKFNQHKIVSSVLLEKDFQSLDYKNTEGIVDYLSYIPNNKFAILLSQDQESIKASLRSNNNTYRVDKLSQLFGGGGHQLASGFKIEANIQSLPYWKIN